MRNQRLLKIETPREREPLWAGEFREMLAKGGDGSSLLPPKFFNYNENGKTLPGKPDIRIIGGLRWVGILSQSGDSALMDSVMGTAVRLVGEHYETPVAIRVESPKFGVVTPVNGNSSEIFNYRLRDMVIKRRTPKRREQDDRTLVVEKLVADLAEIADTYGFDLPPERALGLRIHELRCIGMRLRTTHGETQESVCLANATFSMRANLAGLWQVGQLQARGYGRIFSSRSSYLGRSEVEGKEVLR